MRKLLLPLRLGWWTVTLQLPRRLRLRADKRLLLESGLFDPAFYLQQNPEVARAGINPLEHYLATPTGNSNPHPLFDTAWYRAQNSEVAAAGLNPLVHYLRGGWRQGHSPNPLFDPPFYLEHNPDIAAASVNPLVHCIKRGWREHRNPHPFFDVEFYIQRYPDVGEAGSEPLAHDLRSGGIEKRDPHPIFDSRVSLVIPLFNYGHVLEEALESVHQQTLCGIDVIVVDDRSTDNSAGVAHRWLFDHASEFNMVALLPNRRNSKFGRTRNAAVSFSDTELFMALDADNALLPDCPEKCLAVLDRTSAAFVYLTISPFGDRTGQIGLTQYDPALFPCANDIDAMAMVRKACWIAVGGYSPLDPMGWEDYDFWCKLAEKGLFGVRLPETAARYRTQGESMLRTITELPENMPRVIDDLNTRHPWLQLRAGQSDQ